MAEASEMGAILCIIDGMTHEGFALEQYPNLGDLKQTGAFGMFQTVPEGFPPESYPCIATLLGIEKTRLPQFARGYLEALGAGYSIGSHDLVLRASWMGIDGEGRITCPVGSPKESPKFTCLEYCYLRDFKALLFIRKGREFLESITTYPPYACSGKLMKEIFLEVDSGIAQIMRQSYTKDRVLIPWGQSVPCTFPAFQLRGAVVGASFLFRGLCRALGMEVQAHTAFTADVDTSLMGKAQLALVLAKEYPLVVVHVNGADEAAHRRDPNEKHDFLKQVDAQLIATLKKAACPLLVCADHGTSPVTGKHIGDLQPFVLRTPDSRGDLGIKTGTDAVKLLMEDTLWQNRL